MLAPRIEGAAFLDLYAGSGAVGIEALSRGAAQVTFVERAPAALKVLRANLGAAGTDGGVSHSFRQRGVVSAQAARGAAAGFDVVFLDPPYDAAEEYAAALGLLGGAAAGLLAEGAVVIAEHRRKERLEERYGGLERTRLLEQGDAALSFYSARRRLRSRNKLAAD